MSDFTAKRWIPPTIVLVSALFLFSLNLDRPPHPDELHHVLAAQYLLETGRPLIGQGEYWRGILHTWMVAISYEVFGERLASARIPTVVVVALVAPILFLWVRREAGSLAAWITAVLFITSPFTVEIAQFSRFYALQMFFFVVGTLCIHYALVGTVSSWQRVSFGALACALLTLAIWMQVTSLVGIVGIAAWTLGLVAQRAFFDAETSQAVRKLLIALLILAGFLIVVSITVTDVLTWAWQRFRDTPLFGDRTADDFWFYYVRFLLFYPTLWSLIGLLAVIAAAHNPRIAWLAISIFSISFFLMSFAGPKATRYLSFAPPFLAIIWGVGLASVKAPLQRFLAATRDRLLDTAGLPRPVSAPVGYAVIIVALFIVIATNPFWLRTAAMIGNVALPFETPTTNWRAAREALAWWTKNADIMITTEELGAIYFLGRSDVRYSPNKLAEFPADQRYEFAIDYRVGRPVISKPESLDRLIRCFERGIVVGPIEHWGNPILVSKAVQAVIVHHAKPIEVPQASHLYAWGWARELQEPKSDYCSSLSRFSGLRELH